MRRRRTELRTIPLLLALGCAGLGGVRPSFGPVPGAVVMEVEGTPEAVITAAAAEIVAESLRVRTLSAAEGYLETEWFDSASRAGAGRDPREFRRVVRIRIWADPTAGRTLLVAECVRRVFYDPSRPERELERMVPPGHAGRDILEAALTRLRERFGT